jgi:RNA polymerase sigma factor (sigma-70 family)
MLTDTTDTAQLATDAAAGNEQAWTDLVRRFNPMLRGIARTYRLNSADAEDAVQNTWLRAYCHLDQLRDPGAIGGWLTVTLRREAMRMLQRGVNEIVTDDPRDLDVPDWHGPDEAVLDRDRSAQLHGAVARLPGRQRQVMSSLMTVPPASYEEVSQRLAMPIGSIGPTRERAIARLRGDSELRCALAA